MTRKQLDSGPPARKVSTRTLCVFFGVWISGLFVFGGAIDPISEGEIAVPKLRYPSAMVWLKDRSEILVSHRRSGSVSLVPVMAPQAEPILEWNVGEENVDLAAFDGDRREFLVLDQSSATCFRAQVVGENLVLSEAIRTSKDPVRMLLGSDQTTLYVSCRWSRRLEKYRLSENPLDSRSTKEAALDLSFSPGELLLLDDGKLLVADFHGGRFLVVDTAAWQPVEEIELPANNIRGLHYDPLEQVVLVSNQYLNEQASTHRPEVNWGVMMNNHLRRLPLNLIDRGLDKRIKDGKGIGRVFSLGDELGPGGDPSALAVSRRGEVVIALSGVGRLAVKDGLNDVSVMRVPVGERPIALLMSNESRFVYCLNQFSDSISKVDLDALEVVETIPLGTQPSWESLTAAERGERHFFDASLSLRGWFSCHSCHTEGHANGFRNDNFGDNDFGAPKKILSLLGARDTGPYAWNGEVTSLAHQALKSLDKTMRREAANEVIADHIAAYVETLKAPPGVQSARGVEDSRVARGKEVFRAARCHRCHEPPYFTSDEIYEVGLLDERGRSQFNPPSLRGVSQRDRYFHDGRAPTLTSVFEQLRHPNDKAYSDKDIQALVAYLQTL